MASVTRAPSGYSLGKFCNPGREALIKSRASELIELLGLESHLEGGRYRELFRSSLAVSITGVGKKRSALTTIYYLLMEGGHSLFHRLDADEAWHYYEGAELELFWIDPALKYCNRRLLGPAGELSRPVGVVPAGCWQGARTTGEYTLVGCTVAPGFEYGDFQLLREDPEVEREIRERFPELAALI
mgnify:CR=1 FL=1